LLRHKMLTRDFLGVRQIRGGLFRPKLYTKGLSWHSISWYYPLNTWDQKCRSGIQRKLPPTLAKKTLLWRFQSILHHFVFCLLAAWLVFESNFAAFKFICYIWYSIILEFCCNQHTGTHSHTHEDTLTIKILLLAFCKGKAFPNTIGNIARSPLLSSAK
jgi:hypothetical protein